MLSRFNYAYRYVQPYEDDTLVTQEWQSWNKNILRELSSAADNCYINMPSIRNTMYGNPDIIMSAIAPELLSLLVKRSDMQDWITALYPTPSGGADQVEFGGAAASPDLIQRAYQWLRFVNTYDIKLNNVHSIVEVGGGYGAMALYLKRLIPDVTYYLIETPVMCAIAYQYLQDSLPEVVCIEQGLATENAINIIPAKAAGSLGFSVNIFISQCALCEAPQKMIDLVDSRNWFGAKRGMLMLWQHDYIISKLSEKYNVVVEESMPWPDQHFVFFSPRRKSFKKQGDDTVQGSDATCE